MQVLVALIAGLLFGAGLMLSGMSDPARVLGFLDVAGAWDASLAFVMGGAIAVAAPAFAWVRRRGRTLGGQPVQLPPRHGINRRLLGGSALFGIGWGLAGLCPGPGLVLAGQGLSYGLVFVVALGIGLALVHIIPGKISGHPP